MGWKTKGSLDPKFEDVAFALSASTTASPLYGEAKTEFGYHIIMVGLNYTTAQARSVLTRAHRLKAGNRHTPLRSHQSPHNINIAHILFGSRVPNAVSLYLSLMHIDLTSRGSPPFFVSRCQLKKLEYNRKIVHSDGSRFPRHPSKNPSPHSDAQIQIMKSYPNLLLGLEVVEEDGALLGLFTPVLDDDARAVDDLAGVTLTVQHACKSVLAIVRLSIRMYGNVCRRCTHRDQPTRRAAFRRAP